MLMNMSMLIYDDLRHSPSSAPFDRLLPLYIDLGNCLELSPELGFTFDLLQLSLLQCLAFGHSGFEFLNAFELLCQHSNFSHACEHLLFSQDS